MTRTAEDNVQADPGFFATQAIQPSEVPDDNESYVFVDPLSPSLSDISMSSQMLIRRSYEAASANFAVSFWSWALGTILVACLSTLPFVVCALFVPIASFFAVPIFAAISTLLFYVVPSLAYLSLAQKAAPPSAPSPFLPATRNVRLLFRVNIAAFFYFLEAFRLLFTVGPEIVRTKLLYAIGRSWTGRIKTNIQYNSHRPGALLDIYLPKPIQSSQLYLKSPNQSANAPLPQAPYAQAQGTAPVLIFIPSPHYGPLRTKKWMMTSLGRNLARLGYCVVIPDVVAFGDEIVETSERDEDSERVNGAGESNGARRKTKAGKSKSASRIKESVEELRMVLKWAFENGSTYGGNPEKIYLAGHGLGAHLILLHTIQKAVVSSRDALFQSYALSSISPDSPSNPFLHERNGVSISNGTRRVREYGRDVVVPRVEGLILLSPICDVEKQVTIESELGLSHLSTVRRALGPGQLPCIMHSPAHILHASRNIINVDALPKRILFVHGASDRVISPAQSENMKELLRGVGLADVKCRLYTTGHTGVLTGLMSHERGSVLGAHLERELREIAPV